MSKETVDVVVDSREPDEVIETVVLHEDVEDFLVEELDEGDIKIDDCLFERKTPEDLASSVMDGRLREQVERMANPDNGESRPFVLVEGDMGDLSSLPHTNIPAKSLRGMVASLIARNNIPVVFCSTPGNVVDMAVRIARKTKEEPTIVQTQATDTVKEPSFLTHVFMGVEGVGLKTAEDIAEAMGSLEIAMNCSVEEFMEVDGVGESRAEEIHEHLHSGEENKQNEVTVYNV